MSSNLTTVIFYAPSILDKGVIGNVLNFIAMARLAQLVERKALNLVVVGSSPTVGAIFVVFSYVYLS